MSSASDMSNLIRAFSLTVNNRKKRRPGSHYQEITCLGVVFLHHGRFTRVALNTTELKPLYNSLGEMKEQLAWWGDVTIEGLEEEESA